ncbi:hypothetical protein [Rhodanobacter sp. C03]|uniref:hypothetical protein n=1 Tax=Rhodanobacter sp. C03 TaxID=1945858 RepID=UPI000987A693|nr:hypothetical protein [Rhodanobacter sp. C03]OOG56185.1 hypothetical protein B0E48_08230 [Rhodanobacter sp. C03]
MNSKEAAANASVREALRCIEDKLYETGMLVTATGDSECEVTIAFDDVDIGDAKVFALMVRVATRSRARTSRSCFQTVRQYVLERYSMLQVGLPEDVREPLLDCVGPIVFVNGAMVL